MNAITLCLISATVMSLVASKATAKTRSWYSTPSFILVTRYNNNDHELGSYFCFESHRTCHTACDNTPRNNHCKAQNSNPRMCAASNDLFAYCHIVKSRIQLSLLASFKEGPYEQILSHGLINFCRRLFVRTISPTTCIFAFSVTFWSSILS